LEIPSLRRIAPPKVDRVLSEEQVDEFTERGFLVIPQVVPGDVLAPASAHRCRERRANRRTDPRHVHPFGRDPDDRSAHGGLRQPVGLARNASDARRLLLAHYLLGHNIGRNCESVRTRVALYFRISARHHASHQSGFLQDPWLDLEPVRSRITARPAPSPSDPSRD
jgi:hypothetical protein